MRSPTRGSSSSRPWLARNTIMSDFKLQILEVRRNGTGASNPSSNFPKYLIRNYPSRQQHYGCLLLPRDVTLPGATDYPHHSYLIHTSRVSTWAPKLINLFLSINRQCHVKVPLVGLAMQKCSKSQNKARSPNLSVGLSIKAHK